jgi:3-oxoacyl-[acyl-carrier-protein] synthase II
MDSVIVFSQPELGPPHATGGRAVVITGAATLSPRGLDDARGADALLAGPDATGLDRRHDLEARLDVARARRLDRPARLAAVVALRALEDASVDAEAARETGIVLGSAFGNVDASAAFMHRFYEKGPRFASPAEFPNLVPSSPVGHASIYLGVHGPVFATADLATSGESAIAQAAQLVAAGEAGRMMAGAVEERADIVERVLVALFARTKKEREAPRAEGAAVVVVESEDSARARGAQVLARVDWIREWRDGASPGGMGLAAPREAAGAVVVLPRENGGIEAVLAATGWVSCPRFTCAARTGEHDGLGAVAVAAAVGRLAAGGAREALVVGLAKGRGYAIALSAP